MKPTPGVRLVLRLAWLGICAVVIWGSLLPGTSTPIRTLDLLGVPDKALHLAGYALLATLPALHESRRVLALSLVGALLLGLALELAQSAVEGRSFEFGDLAANAAGLLAGLLLGSHSRSRQPRPR